MQQPNSPILKSKSESLTDHGNRLHGIDALRGIAMILGMLLHATIAYKEKAIPAWPHDKDFNHWSFDFLYHFVHSFRMPLFFLIAGYFSRLMYHKIGEQAFLKHRFKRIIVPFVFSLIFILPLTILPFSIYRYSTIFQGNWDLILENSFKDIFSWRGMAHLWFLYYLIIYYILAITFLRVRKTFFTLKITPRISPVSSFFYPGNFSGLFVFILLTWLILIPSNGLYFHVDTGVLPHAAYLLFYALFFLKGWLINKNTLAFTWLRKKVWVFISLGAMLSLVLFLLEYRDLIKEGSSFLALKLVAGAQINLLVFGVIGFFLRYCHAETKLWRYISDASYWMYLIHLGIIAGLQIYFMNTNLPGMIRFLLVLIIPIVITLVTYHYFVRFTVVGTYLHGKRSRG